MVISLVKKKDTKKEKPEKVININKLDDVPGLGPVSIERLTEQGITNMISLWAGMNNPTKLVSVTGIEKIKAEKALKFVRKSLEDAGALGVMDQTADKTYDDILKRKKLRLGCTSIEDILRGGFETSVLHELFGHEGSGKTQFLHSLAIHVTYPLEEGGLYDKVNDGEKQPFTLFIDTESTFRPDRIHSILEGRGMITQFPKEIKKKLLEHKTLTKEESTKYHEIYEKQLAESKDFMAKHILHWKSKTAASLFANLQNANNLISTGFPVKLLIIDSLTEPFRANYVGRGSMWSRTDDLKEIMKMISDMTETHKLVTIFISQVYGSPDSKQWEDDVQAYGGHIVGHKSQIRLRLDIPSSNSTAEKRRLTIVKAAHLPNDQALYKITSKGIENYE